MIAPPWASPGLCWEPGRGSGSEHRTKRVTGKTHDALADSMHIGTPDQVRPLIRTGKWWD